jgi:hypothetical protein
VTAAVVGALLGLAFIGMLSLLFSGNVCSGWGCLWFVLMVTPAVLVLAAVLAWPLLRVAKVSKAGQVALLGPIAALPCWDFLEVPQFEIDTWIRPVIAGAVGYAAAAFVTAPSVQLVWRILIAAGVVALIPLETLLSSMWEDSRLADELRGYGHPLLAPSLAGYQVEGHSVNKTQPMLSYRLRPSTSAGPSLEILVTQMPVPAGFNPPANCNLAGNQTEPCTQVAASVWRTSQTGYVVTRRGDQVVQFRPGASVPENDPFEASASLREVVPGDFPSR